MHTKEEKLEAFARLLDIQERLRKECPWDRKQTNESLRPHTLEEVFELTDALIKNDSQNICKELGDVMEHIVLYSLLGEEQQNFDIADVCNKQSDKLMFRHDFIDWRGWKISNPEMTINPAGQVVYKDESIPAAAPAPTTSAQVETTWEQRKQKERDGNKTVLAGVPASLPSLIKAYRIQDKARNVGFDWKNPDDVWQKVHEELQELQTELKKNDTRKATSELGDFIFSIINAARLYKLNPDNALELTNQKFIRRFNYIEEKARQSKREIKSLTLEEMDELWNQAKKINDED